MNAIIHRKLVNVGDENIEAVARALCEFDNSDPDMMFDRLYSGDKQEGWRFYVEEAIVAINAMNGLNSQQN